MFSKKQKLQKILGDCKIIRNTPLERIQLKHMYMSSMAQDISREPAGF